MPYTVLGGPTVLPGGIPQNRWYNDIGQIQGHGADLLMRALLASLTGGAGGGGLGRVPAPITAQNPGTFNFPQGSSSPLEQEQIHRLGGVPTQQGVMARSTQDAGPGGVTYAPPTRFGFKPNLMYQLNQLKLQEAQQSLDPNSLDNRLKQADLRKRQMEADPNSPINQMYIAYAKGLLTPKDNTDTSNSSPISEGDLTSQLAELALSGDEEALAVLRKLGAL